MDQTQEKLYPKMLTQQDFDTWITDYLNCGWYLFFINPNTKTPFSHEAFELPEEAERRTRELDEEAQDPTLNNEARAKARQNDQNYGKGLLDATNDIGDRQHPAPGTGVALLEHYVYVISPVGDESLSPDVSRVLSVSARCPWRSEPHDVA